MNNLIRRRRASQGQAAVELALMSLIIIPCFLYIIFIDDMLRFKQDQQEAMIATGWDFTTLNWDHQTKTITSKNDYLPNNPACTNCKGPAHEEFVTHFNRYAFADHTSSTPRFEDPESNTETHHLATGAHQCWLVGGKSNQVTCTRVDQNMAANFNVDLTVNGRTGLRDMLMGPGGGFYTCKGRVGVINHWLPSGVKFLNSKEELSSRKYHHTDIEDDGSNLHGVAAGMATSEAYHFPVDTFGVVANTWAMTDADAVSPANSPRFPGSLTGPALYDRVVKIYNAIGPDVTLVSANIYPIQAISKQLLSPAAIIDGPFGDLMMTPEVTFVPKYDPKNGDGFYASQYWDFQNNPVQKTYSKRGTWYLGRTKRP